MTAPRMPIHDWMAERALGIEDAIAGGGMLDAYVESRLSTLQQEIERLTAERDALRVAMGAANDDRDACAEALARLTADHAALRTVVREARKRLGEIEAAHIPVHGRGPAACPGCVLSAALRVLDVDALAALGGGNG